MDTEDSVLSKWTELKTLVETLELDMQKNARGVAAAGVRVRRGLRALKASAAILVKTTVELDKEKKSAKPKKSKKT